MVTLRRFSCALGVNKKVPGSGEVQTFPELRLRAGVAERPESSWPKQNAKIEALRDPERAYFRRSTDRVTAIIMERLGPSSQTVRA